MVFPQPIDLSTDDPLLTTKCTQTFPKEDRLAAIAETQSIHSSTTPYYN